MIEVNKCEMFIQDITLIRNAVICITREGRNEISFEVEKGERGNIYIYDLKLPFRAKRRRLETGL